MIKFLNVSKSYGPSKFALRDVDLQISQGEFVFLSGSNGAGKTTLLKLINVMERPTSGQVIIEGAPSDSMRRKKVALLRRKIGVIFQDIRLLRGRTVEENIRLALEVSGVHRDTHTAKLIKVLTFLNLLSKRDLYPPELSWGEQQRVSIARAIVNQPHILLADEPSEKLDSSTAIEILDTLRDVNLWGTTVILASHNPDLPVKGVSRVVDICEGKIEGDRTLSGHSADSY
jgi:cell division transport system ATP-binding protein